MNFILRLETLASPDTLRDAIKELCEISNRLKLSLVANINGKEVMACPGDNHEDLYFVFSSALDTASTVSLLTTSHVGYFKKLNSSKF